MNRLFVVLSIIFSLAACTSATLRSDIAEQKYAIASAYEDIADSACVLANSHLDWAENHIEPTPAVAAEIAYLRGACLEKQSKQEEAIGHYRYLLEAYPDSEYAYRVRNKISVLEQNQEPLSGIQEPLSGILAELFAQDTEVATEQNPTTPVEEIIVTGQITLSQMQSRLEFAKLAVFDLYNEINQDDYYDVACNFESPIGTRITRQVCEPAFVEVLEANAYQEALAGFIDNALLAQRVREEHELMEAHMILLANQHPEFLAQAQGYVDLSREYQQLKDEHCEGKTICLLNAVSDTD